MRSSWQIEQRVGRGHLPASSRYNDQMIRARDGYWLVCEVQPGDRMACPKCARTLSVPRLCFAEVRCPRCMFQGRDGRTMAGYFPLGAALFSHLTETDPRRGAIARMAAKADSANQKLVEQADRDLRNSIQAATLEDFNRLFGIQSVGYTGKEQG